MGEGIEFKFTGQEIKRRRASKQVILAVSICPKNGKVKKL
jgi:hypothetical protein